MPDVSFDAVIIIVQVAQVRVAAAESSIQIAYLSVNDKVELDIKYADELGRLITFLSISNTSILRADVFFGLLSSGYIFNEAHGVVPVEIETNYPDVVSILMTRDFNGTYDTSERFVLQVCHGTTCFCSVEEYRYNTRFKAWACLTLSLFMQTEFFVTL